MANEITVYDRDLPLTPPQPDLPAVITQPESPHATPQESRNAAVAGVLAKAYERASTLELTDAEIAKLTAEFPDDAVTTGAGGDAHLLYIQHAFIRQRLGSVFKPGAWSLINRRTWYDADSGNMYAECVLLIRGCFIGEATGAMKYQPKNARLNYSDAVEGAQSEALRRIAGKYLGCGLQVWQKSYCQGWFERQRAGKDKQITAREEQRETAARSVEQDAPDIPWEKPEPFTGKWEDVVIHFGKNNGTRLADLDSKQLNWYRKEWQPRPFRGKVSPEDTALRSALDSIGEHMSAVDKLRIKLFQITKPSHGGDRDKMFAYLVDEGFLADTESLPDLSETRLAEIIAKVEAKQ